MTKQEGLVVGFCTHGTVSRLAFHAILSGHAGPVAPIQTRMPLVTIPRYLVLNKMASGRQNNLPAADLRSRNARVDAELFASLATGGLTAKQDGPIG